MSSAGISRTGQGTKRAQAFCIAYISRRSNKDGWLGYPLSTSFQKWSKAVSKIRANEERHPQQMRATLINTVPRSYYTVSVRASKCATCYCMIWFIYLYVHMHIYTNIHTYVLIYQSQIISFSSFKICFSNRLWVTKINLRLLIQFSLVKKKLTFEPSTPGFLFWNKPVRSTQHQNLPVEAVEDLLASFFWFQSYF